MSDNIRVGLIGYGYASKTFHAPLIACLLYTSPSPRDCS